MDVALLASGRFFAPLGERVTVPTPVDRAGMPRLLTLSARHAQLSRSRIHRAAIAPRRRRQARTAVATATAYSGLAARPPRLTSLISHCKPFRGFHVDCICCGRPPTASSWPLRSHSSFRDAHVLPLILMFGVCDALGSALGVSVPVAGGLAAIALIACGALLVLRLPVAHRLDTGGGLGLRPAAAACDRQCRVAHAGPIGLVALSSARWLGSDLPCGATALVRSNASPAQRTTARRRLA